MMSPDEALAWLRAMKTTHEAAIDIGVSYWPDYNDVEALDVAIACLEEKCHE